MSWFKSKVVDRLKEPSSMAGIGLIAAGIGQTFGINEAQQAGEVIQQAATQPNWIGFTMAALGSLAILFREKGGNK